MIINFLNWITEISELFENILTYWNATIHSQSYTGPSKHKHFHSHPSSFGEQFLKTIDSVIMQQLRKKIKDLKE